MRAIGGADPVFSAPCHGWCDAEERAWDDDRAVLCSIHPLRRTISICSASWTGPAPSSPLAQASMTGSAALSFAKKTRWALKCSIRRSRGDCFATTSANRGEWRQGTPRCVASLSIASRSLTSQGLLLPSLVQGVVYSSSRKRGCLAANVPSATKTWGSVRKAPRQLSPTSRYWTVCRAEVSWCTFSAAFEVPGSSSGVEEPCEASSASSVSIWDQKKQGWCGNDHRKSRFAQ